MKKLVTLAALALLAVQASAINVRISLTENFDGTFDTEYPTGNKAVGPPNDPPEWVATPNPVCNEGVASSVSIVPENCTDPDGDTLTLTLQSGTLPTGVTLDDVNDELDCATNTSPGTTTGLVLGCDDGTASRVDSSSFSLTVNAEQGGGDPPVFGFTTLFSLNNVRGDQTGWSGSYMTSDDDGNVYYALMNTANQIQVGKWTKATDTEEHTDLTPNITGQDTHHMLAIALDKNGRIHVFGPVHQDPMEYWVSDALYSVTGGFTKQTATNNIMRGLHVGTTKSNGDNAITYPYTFYDTNDNPYVGFRFRVSPDGFQRQAQAAQLSRYNSATDLWEQIGGNTNVDYDPTVAITFPDPKIPAFMWSTQTSSNALNDAYQAWGDRQWTDSTGRIHFAMKHFDGGTDAPCGGWGTDVVYFYSDDLGVTWRTADGTAVTDEPIVVPGSHDASMYVVGPAGSPKCDYHGVTAGRGSDGNPVVGYESRDGAATYRFSKWNGTSWDETNTGFSANSADLLISSDGGLWYLNIGNGFIRVSDDNGATWTQQFHNLGNAQRGSRTDGRHFLKTNKLRFAIRPNAGNTVTFVEYVDTAWVAP